MPVNEISQFKPDSQVPPILWLRTSMRQKDHAPTEPKLRLFQGLNRIGAKLATERPVGAE